MSQVTNKLVLVKETEVYLFVYDDESTATLLQTLGKFAQDKELSFTWYDAAILSQKVRLLRQQRDASETPTTEW